MLELRKRIRSTIAERTGRSFEDVERDTQRNCWLTAPQAVEYGLVGRVVKHISEVAWPHAAVGEHGPFME